MLHLFTLSWSSHFNGEGDITDAESERLAYQPIARSVLHWGQMDLPKFDVFNFFKIFDVLDLSCKWQWWVCILILHTDVELCWLLLRLLSDALNFLFRVVYASLDEKNRRKLVGWSRQISPELRQMMKKFLSYTLKFHCGLLTPLIIWCLIASGVIFFSFSRMLFDWWQSIGFCDEKKQTGGLNLMPCWLSAKVPTCGISLRFHIHTDVASTEYWIDSEIGFAMMRCFIYVWTYELVCDLQSIIWAVAMAGAWMFQLLISYMGCSSCYCGHFLYWAGPC